MQRTDGYAAIRDYAVIEDGRTAAVHFANVEPPAFMLVNYGRQTALVTLVGHRAYGAIVGAFAAGL